MPCNISSSVIFDKSFLGFGFVADVVVVFGGAVVCGFGVVTTGAVVVCVLGAAVVVAAAVVVVVVVVVLCVVVCVVVSAVVFSVMLVMPVSVCEVVICIVVIVSDVVSKAVSPLLSVFEQPHSITNAVIAAATANLFFFMIFLSFNDKVLQSCRFVKTEHYIHVLNSCSACSFSQIVKP